jgi:hypothetical protein
MIAKESPAYCRTSVLGFAENVKMENAVEVV